MTSGGNFKKVSTLIYVSTGLYILLWALRTFFLKADYISILPWLIVNTLFGATMAHQVGKRKNWAIWTYTVVGIFGVAVIANIPHDFKLNFLVGFISAGCSALQNYVLYLIHESKLKAMLGLANASSQQSSEANTTGDIGSLHQLHIETKPPPLLENQIGQQFLQFSVLNIFIVTVFSIQYAYVLMATVSLGDFPLLEIGIFALMYFSLRTKLSLNFWQAVLFPAIFIKGVDYIIAFSSLSGLFLWFPLMYKSIVCLLATLALTKLTELPSKSKLALVGVSTAVLAWLLTISESENIHQQIVSGDYSSDKIMTYRVLYSMIVGVSVFTFMALFRIPKTSKLWKQIDAHEVGQKKEAESSSGEKKAS